MNSIPINISNKILTIGPDYRNHRGGIGAVIEVYNKYFEQFKFLASSNKIGYSIYKFLFFIGSIFKLFQLLIFDRKIQIIHFHGSSYGSFFRKFILFLLVKYIFQKKVIYHIHSGVYDKFYKNNNATFRIAIKYFIEHSDVVICLSESWKIFFLENFKPKKIFITPNIIDFPYMSKLIKKEKIITFLFLGFICDAKGIFDLTEIIHRKREKYTNKIRLIIGGNGEIERLTTLIHDHNLEGLVKFIGWITNKEKIAWLNKANIYILPSFNEGLPISILEAMSYGQAIISTNVGGIPEIVIPKKNGILVEPGDLSEIETAIDFFIEHPEKIEEYGHESRQIAKKYQPDSVIMELTAIYKSLLSND